MEVDSSCRVQTIRFGFLQYLTFNGIKKATEEDLVFVDHTNRNPTFLFFFFFFLSRWILETFKAHYTKEILGKCHLSTILLQPNILEEPYSEKSCMNWLVLFSQVIILSLKFAVDILITALYFSALSSFAYTGSTTEWF
jgi:hypothetical protein